MIFYEIELQGTPEITIACSVEYENYKNSFYPRNDYLEIALCEKGRAVYSYPDGKAELVLPHMLIPILGDKNCISFAYKGEMQRHTTVAVRVKHTLKRYESESDCDLEALYERMKNNCTILIPYNTETGEKYDEFLYSLKKICHYAHSGSPCGRINALSEWYKLAGKLSDFVLESLAKKHDDISPSEIAYAANAEKYMIYNHDRKIAVSEIAAHVGISPGYLHRVFKKVKGEGITEYLNHYRVSIAIELMREKGMSLSEAAANVGISDHSYMSRLFKKTTGVPYREYIKRNSEKIRL